ncbi:MAG TPA: TetR/AcrR family transcriptional regulator [Solirubrobacteraceae bacterium]|jgi:AcrR family transcriptional regulator|nr:TetR/AcrR family transcriptional regulator [Solirubrobacteraceae bacterium]
MARRAPSKPAAAGEATEPANGTRPSGRAGLRRRLVEREILERAAELFAQRGFAGTTVQDIADALGMSRPALYYYVKSKEVILEQLVENLSINDAKVLDSIRRRRSGDPVEKLREMANHLATNASSNPYQTQILTQSKHHLPAEIAERDREAERSIVLSLIWVLEQGMRRGQFRSLDPRTAALAIVGMCLWTAWWVQDTPPQGLTAQVADQAVASVIAVDGSLQADSPADLLRAARAGLDRLQAALDG